MSHHESSSEVFRKNLEYLSKSPEACHVGSRFLQQFGSEPIQRLCWSRCCTSLAQHVLKVQQGFQLSLIAKDHRLVDMYKPKPQGQLGASCLELDMF